MDADQHHWSVLSSVRPDLLSAGNFANAKGTARVCIVGRRADMILDDVIAFGNAKARRGRLLYEHNRGVQAAVQQW
jgi:hypothetical protein